MELKENQAIARGRDLAVSTKHCVEICNFVRGKTVVKAQARLERVLNMKEAIPFKRYGKDIGHRKGTMAAGRYPVKAVGKVLEVINSAEKNAQNKGLNVEGLIIKIIKADKASRPMRGGRKGRVQAKRTHIEIVVEEVIKKEEKKTESKSKKTTEKKETEKQ